MRGLLGPPGLADRVRAQLSALVCLENRGGGGVGTKAACVIRNAGPAPVTVNVSLVSNFEAFGISNYCKEDNGQPRTLAGGETCIVSANLSEGGSD